MEVFLLAATLFVALVSALLNIYIIRKVWWVFKLSESIKQTSARHARQLFRQIQMLEALKQDLNFSRTLPPAGGMAGSPDFLKALSDHVLSQRPSVVVECGSGLSTIVVARSLQLNGNGHIFSLDHVARYADQTRLELKRQDLPRWGSVLDAPLVEHRISGNSMRWYDTTALPSEAIDMLIIDGPPASTGLEPRYPAGPILFSRLAPHGVVFVDDAGRPEELAVVNRWQTQFPHLTFETNSYDFQKGLCIVKRTAGKV